MTERRRVGCGSCLLALVGVAGLGMCGLVIKGAVGTGSSGATEAGRQAPTVDPAKGLKWATEVAAKSDLCTSTPDVWSAWVQIKGIKRGDAQYEEARRTAAALERCRRGIAGKLIAQMKAEAPRNRDQIARRLERGYLDAGVDARVRTEGSAKDRLRISWILAGRVFAHKVTDGGSMREGGFLNTLQVAGFRRVTFSDGHGETHYYDLEPPAPKPFEEAELNEPFELAD